MAIGMGAISTHDNDVALGAGSVTAAAVATTGATIGGNSYTFAGTTPTSTVSVGDVGAERTITNVAAGRLSDTSTDAVNGSQLKATNDQVGINTTNITNNTTDINGLKDDALQWDPAANGGAGAYSANHKGNGTSKITNVTAGDLTDTSTDAVNGSQLKATNDQVDINTTNIATNTTDITNLGDTVENIYNTGTKYFHANSTGTDSVASGLDAVAIGMGAISTHDNDVALGAGSVTAAAVATTGATIGGNSYTFAGTAPTSTVSVGDVGAERTITNVAAGRLSDTSTDAVNGSQLKATNDQVDINTTDINGLKDDALQWDPAANGGAGAYSANHKGNGTSKITNVTAGDLTDTSTDAVNGSQLKATNDQVDINTTNIATNTTDITNLGDTVENIYNTGTKYFHANSTGTDSSALGQDAVAIGMGAIASADGSIALGAGSLADGSTLSHEAYLVGGKAKGEVNVGDRRLTGLSAGADDTDAVNVAQLKATAAGSVADAVMYDNSTHNNITLGGNTYDNSTHTGGTTITNVADGVAPSDAVNFSQLTETNNNVTNLGDTVTNLGDTITNINDHGTKYFHANSTGTDSSALGQDSVAIGMGAISTHDNDVALGAGSKTTAAVGTAGTTINGDKYTFAGTTPSSTVSVGDVGAERTITNVAAGRLNADSTDAVNGSQLFATNQSIDTLGTQVETNTTNIATNTTNIANNTTNIAGNTNNINELKDDALQWDPAANGGAGAYSANHKGNGPAKITNVAAGDLTDTSTDAVNGSQLKATNDQLDINTTNIAGNTTAITNLGDTVDNIYNTGTKYFHANSTGTDSVASGLDAVAIGMGAIASADGSIALGAGSLADGSTLSHEAYLVGGTAKGEVNVGDRRITGLSAGADDTDAVNVAQLKATAAGSVADAVMYDNSTHNNITLGGNTYDNSTHTGGTTITNVADGVAPSDAVNYSQLTETNNQVTTNTTNIANNTTNINGLKDDALQWDASLNAYSADHMGNGPAKITNVAAGDLTDTSTDAVNGSQLKATNDQVDINTTNIAGNTTAITNLGDTVENIYNTGTKYFHANSTGTDSVASGLDAVAIGMGAIASADGSIALGAGSLADGSTLSHEAYLVGGTAKGEVNVGDRRITGLAAGADDTDAVNVAQLKQVATESVADAVMYDNSTHNNITLGGDTYDNSTHTGGTTITNVADGVAPSDAVNFSQLTETNNSVTNLGDTVNNIYTTGTKYFHANSTGTDSVASGLDAVAIGMGAIASADNSIALGAGSLANGSTLSHQAYLVGGTAKGEVNVGNRRITGVAAGADATDAVNVEQLAAVVNHYYSFNDAGTHDINYDNAGATGANSIAAGINAAARGDGSVATGVAAMANGSHSISLGYGTVVNGARSAAIGDPTVVNGDDSYSLGNDNLIDSNKVFVVGSNVKVDAGLDGAVVLGDSSTASAAVATTGVTLNGKDYAFAGTTPTSSVSVGAVGAERTITNVAAGRLNGDSTDAVNGSQLFATNQAIDGLQGGSVQYDKHTDGTVNYNNVTLGGDTYDNSTHTGGTTITNVADGKAPSDAVNFSQLTETNNNVTNLGDTVTNLGDTVTNLGDTVTNINDHGTKYFHANSTGTDSVASGIDAVAIGMGAVASADGSVALGAGSLADGSTLAHEAYLVGGTAKGEVNVGDRRITGLAAGADDADAVNVAQLKQVATESVADVVKYDNSTHNNITLDGNTYDNSTHTGGTTITNVADGKAPSDAVNYSQLTETNTNITNLGDTVTNINNKGTKYFHANSTGTDSVATGIDAVAIGMGAVASADGSIALGAGSLANGSTLSHQAYLVGGTAKGEVNVGDRRITGLSAGADDADAVNVAQLKQVTSGAVADAVMYDNSTHNNITLGGTTYDNSTHTGGTTITNVADGKAPSDAVNYSQLTETNNQVAINTTNITNNTNDINGLKDDALQWDAKANGGKGAYSANHMGNGPAKITYVAAGDISATSTDAVNGSQLFGLQTEITNITNNGVKYFHANSTAADSKAVSAESIAVGGNAQASGVSSIAMGSNAQTSTDHSVAIGGSSSVTGKTGTAIGDGAIVTADNAVALGAGSVADRMNSVSVGSKGKERQITNVAAGTEDTDAVNLAQLKQVSGDITNIDNSVKQNSTDITNIQNGTDGMFQVKNTDNLPKPSVTGNNSVAGGAGSKASGNNSMAVGTSSTASGANSVALGNGSSATAENSVALGSGSVADRTNSVSVGSAGNERQITNVAAGTKGTDGVNVNQLTSGINESKEYTNSKFSDLKNQVDKQNDKLEGGIAGAMAMASMPQPYSAGASMFSMGGASYGSQGAVAMGVSTISDNGKWVTKLQGTTTTQGDVGVAVGVGYQW
ncbi:YadA-like family protein [Serratia fonticola]|uniref:YadA-like family protein n=1 Tax=Serratia fonticola TaxID=47917 RepID=UPI000410CBBD|nr:YadA-like family protein [Serratia fonticola]